jgi:hypothetical protein
MEFELNGQTVYSGASNDGDDGLYGLNADRTRKIADDIMEDDRRYGSVPRSDAPKPRPRRNLHLDGDGYGEGR